MLGISSERDCDSNTTFDSFSPTLLISNSTIPIAENYFFEGAEKLLEIWFDHAERGNGSLRFIPRVELEKMLEVVRCHILHFRGNEFMDSYVLSESSMFISDRRIILKTCGETCLLNSIGIIINLAKQYADLHTVLNVFYSRKSFLRPEKQIYPHESFHHEFNYLNAYFKDGNIHIFGPATQDWFLYTLSDPGVLTGADHTLEILMEGLPKDVRDVFTKKVSRNARDCVEKVGISRFLPRGTIVHDELFEPCGYSLNGILPNSDQYVTVHVTPEYEFSYASFETNQSSMCLYKQTLSVIEIFRPEKFMFSLFANERSHNVINTLELLWKQGVVGYERKFKQFVQLKGHDLVYALFVQR